MTDISSVSLPDWLDVSRETYDRMLGYLALVEKWSAKINLIGRGSLHDAWNRHVLDSAQLVAISRDRPGPWVDLGSGAGFPGLVVAIMMRETEPNRSVILVESDQRKATFLRQAAHDFAPNAQIICDRAETIPSLNAAILSARALAHLSELCRHADRHLAADGLALFLKGAQYEGELAMARRDWVFDVEVTPSCTDPTAAVLALRNIRHA